MLFEVGETVVYPRHGAAMITTMLPDPFTEGQGHRSRRDQDRVASAGKKVMLAKTRQILASGLVRAEITDEQKASTVLDEVFAS